MIYLDDNIWDFDLQHALSKVSPWRRDYALRYRRELDQRLCVAAYLLLQSALQQEYGITEVPRFLFDDSGKPSLEGHANIHFSLSHCDKAVACAVSDQPVGIDVETYDHYNEDLARELMNETEIHQILTSFRPDITFTRFWTMKESLYKMKGGPLDRDIPNILNNTALCHFTTFIHKTYLLTSCTQY